MSKLLKEFSLKELFFFQEALKKYKRSSRRKLIGSGLCINIYSTVNKNKMKKEWKEINKEWREILSQNKLKTIKNETLKSKIQPKQDSGWKVLE